jgi:hypothetical protein
MRRRRIFVPAADVRRWFGKPLPIATLVEGLKELHDRVLPKSEYRFDTRLEIRYEELLHELGHAVALRPREWHIPLDIPLGTALERLGPMTREGNEIDALGFSIVVSEMFGQPIGMRFVDLAVRSNNLKIIFKPREARSLVRGAMTAPGAEDLAFVLAQEVYKILHAKGKV